MAMNDHATFADKICLANDLKDRRDRRYAKALLWHILPNVPKRDKLEILKSDSLNDWLHTDPRGQWCSQNDKALMYMTVKSHICNNSQKFFHWTGQTNAENVSEHTESDDLIKRVIKNWRGPSLENFDEVPREYITSECTGSCSNISRPKPLDNSICPPESAMFGSLVEYPIRNIPSFPGVSKRHFPSLEQAKAGNLRAQPNHDCLPEHLPKSSHSEGRQGEKRQNTSEAFGGAQEKIARFEARDIVEALSGMQLNNSSGVTSEQKPSGESSKAKHAFIARNQQIRNEKKLVKAETHAHLSGKVLMRSCRTDIPPPPVCQIPQGQVRRSIRLATRASTNTPVNTPRKDTGRISKNEPKRVAARQYRRDEQRDQDLRKFRHNPNVQLTRKRMNRIGALFAYDPREAWMPKARAALLEYINTAPNEQKLHHRQANAEAREQLRTTPSAAPMELDNIERRIESMDIS
ncbi:hypothetical protein MMC29_002167 [Sticta canariensis]|nr:hypothetical protein [Sticta canariensis]